MVRRGLAFVVAAVALCGSLEGAVVKQVVRPGVAAANLLKPEAWRRVGKDFGREGEILVCDNGGDSAGIAGIIQTVTLNQKTAQPIIAIASSKAENVSGGKDADYSLYLDLSYMDGTHLWGQIAPFDVGSHDWQERQVRITPEKPIKEVYVYLLLRRHGGKALFRNPRLSEVEIPEGASPFDGLAVVNRAARSGLAVRDVAADSDFVSFENNKAFGLDVAVDTTTAAPRVAFQNVRVTNTTGKDRAITLVYTLRLPAGSYRWLIDPRREEPARGPRDYRVLSAGRLSRYPVAAVAGSSQGHAIIVDMSRPAVFRAGYSSASNELYLAYDLALAPEKNSAEVRFCTVTFDPAWGFRAAVAAMYAAFPDQFRSRTPKQGIWMPFYKISQVEGWEDFGFKFKEGNDETAWDDAHDIITFRYTEPMTWWMPMPKEMPRTLEAALAHARELAAKGDKNAQALLACGHHDRQGRFVAQLLDTPWCNGAVWSMNSSPGIAGAVTDFGNKWSPARRESLYGPNSRGNLDGEYIDSSEGYVTEEYDFRREHFGAQRTSLTFDPESHRPAILRGLIAYEYARAIAEDIHSMNKLMMANSTPDRLCWLAPLLDVMGTETDWNPEKRWQPMSDQDMLYRRVLCGPKPYCFLMNTVFDDFPYGLTEKYFKRCLAYGMFPGFFSHNASQGHYFSRPELYNRDRPLFKKYIPLCKVVAEAGWQPVTLARSSEGRVYVERFGEKYLTVFNDSAEKKTARISLEGLKARGSRELVRDRQIAWRNGGTELTLEGEDVAVIDLDGGGTGPRP